MKWKQWNPHLLGGIPIPLPKCVATHQSPIDTNTYILLCSLEITRYLHDGTSKSHQSIASFCLGWPLLFIYFSFPSSPASLLCGGRQFSLGCPFSVEKESIASCFFLTDLVCWPLVLLAKIVKKKQCGTNRPTFSLVVF